MLVSPGDENNEREKAYWKQKDYEENHGYYHDCVTRLTIKTSIDLPFRILIQNPLDTTTPHLFIADLETGYIELGCFKLTRKAPKTIRNLRPYYKAGEGLGLKNITNEQKELIVMWASLNEMCHKRKGCNNWTYLRQEARRYISYYEYRLGKLMPPLPTMIL